MLGYQTTFPDIFLLILGILERIQVFLENQYFSNWNFFPIFIIVI